jgi:hypothetical protein
MIPIYLIVAALVALTGYPTTHSGVIFSHSSHYGTRNIECVDCHTKVAKSISAQDKLIPGHDDCSSCHSVDKAPNDCKLCHTDPNNPSGVAEAKQEVKFSHQSHLDDSTAASVCLTCHPGIDKLNGHPSEANFPSMNRCFKCHDGIKAAKDCKECHTKPAEMQTMIHPSDYLHAHRFDADAKETSCEPCHQKESSCSECHAGDNLVRTVHNSNYRFTHGLDAKGKEFECRNCHDYETFCNDCHNQEGDIPLNHYAADWNPRTSPTRHAEEARKDIESCAGCHEEEGRSTCAQPGCHWDGDGVRGTQPSIHASSITDLDHGPWHNDPGFQCFQCHISTHTPGVGFCGYCHGTKGN